MPKYLRLEDIDIILPDDAEEEAWKTPSAAKPDPQAEVEVPGGGTATLFSRTTSHRRA